MTKERAWPARAMYMLLAAALAIGLMIVAGPAQKVSASPGLSEWTRVDTPTTDGWVLAPGSVIKDAAYAAGGEVAYAILYQRYGPCPDPCQDDFVTAQASRGDYYLLKSEDYGATWDDITEALEDELDDGYFVLLRVATDWEDPDFVAVALDIPANTVYVAFSTDGGTTFIDTGEVEDGVSLDLVSDLAVSPEAAGKREIAIGGTNGTAAALFRSTVTGDSASSWEDATAYAGWDDDDDPTDLTPGPFDSELVTDIIFSPSWALDKTILVTTVDTYGDGLGSFETGDVHLQCGSWGTSEGWNEYSTLGIEAVPILEDENLPIWIAFMFDARGIAGVTLPEDYNSKNTDDRVLWAWVNYYDPYPTAMCQITRVEDDSADPVGPMGQIEDGELWLTNISYQGTIAEGEALAGVLGNGMGDYTDCCEGVQVYHNDGIRNMDICCERWQDACKPPTGRNAMGVTYVGEDKAYAVALHSDVSYYGEGAWSVTFDDGDTWNQLSLIDTYISWLTDVAVSPDCNKTFLVSVSMEPIDDQHPECFCDSVWLRAETLPEAEEYSGQWLRTWSGQLEGRDYGLLRLAPEETTGDTVFLVDYDSSNVYRNDLETLACWDPIGSTVLDNIVDLALLDADALFALDYDGHVAIFDDDEWQEAVESEVEKAHTIAVWGDWILVGGDEGEVSYSDDGGETFTLLEDFPTIDGRVTVAFDTYFDTNMTIYAASGGWNYLTPYGGIYSWVIGESEEWTDLKAEPLESQIFGDKIGETDDTFEVAFTGMVVDRPGNPFTDAENGGVIYATYMGSWNGTRFTGVARSLERTVDVCTTCLDWDFLHVGLTSGDPEEDCPYPESFSNEPHALKICGCLTPDSNTHLFAIDSQWEYDFCDNDFGSLWTYEDCYAKKAPDISSPLDGAVIPADPCSCYSAPFTVVWDSICDACSFDIAFAMDEDFTMPVPVNGLSGLVYHIVSDTPSFSVMGGEAGGLSCETTYYIRTRAADAATGEIIHTWWSDPIAITIAPSVEAGVIDLVAPAPGALNVPVSGVGFSWDLLATADSFDWVLSENSDLSSPLDSKTGLTGKAASYAGTLDYSTTYYWQVTAYNEGAMVGMSAVGTFTTMAEPYVPPEEEPEGTPMWVWVVIAIGAVLVIVVIVLIFRTRRV